VTGGTLFWQPPAISSDPKEPSKEKPEPGPAPDKAEVAPSGLPDALTPEEQMRLFEKELKENDWGHQPC